jgi:hypothetical protein
MDIVNDGSRSRYIYRVQMIEKPVRSTCAKTRCPHPKMRIGIKDIAPLRF